MALAAAKASGPPKGRGRPKKFKADEGDQGGGDGYDEEDDHGESSKVVVSVGVPGNITGSPRPRGRGRPPKPKSEAAMALAAAKASVFGPKRGRGRPPQNRDESGGAAVEERKVSEPSRPRGRPKKIRVVEGECDHHASSGVVPVGVPGGAGLDIISPGSCGRPPKVKFAIGTTVGF